ncbi:hypothetical protein BX666DRAFT_2028365 [Dichotomocladium elegans]|nr:hypothetical protein BX666DRAFT_2028365 [Dichotomocladium elegans]
MIDALGKVRRHCHDDLFKISLKKVYDYVLVAWSRIIKETIANCWRHTGLLSDIGSSDMKHGTTKEQVEDDEQRISLFSKLFGEEKSSTAVPVYLDVENSGIHEMLTINERVDLLGESTQGEAIKALKIFYKPLQDGFVLGILHSKHLVIECIFKSQNAVCDRQDDLVFGNIGVFIHFKEELEEQLIGQGLGATQISQRIRETPATTFKPIVARRNISRDDVPEDPAYLQEAFDAIQPIFDAYTSTHAFDNDSIYYDAKVHPIQHMAAFYQFALLFERLQVPASVLYPGGWDEVIDVHSKALKPAENGVFRFRGTLETDGVGVSIIQEEKGQGCTPPRTSAAPKVEEHSPYVDSLTAEKHREIAGRCVTVDPGRRDMLYCVHERPISLEPVKFGYTKQEQDKIREIKHRRLIQNSRTRTRKLSSETIHKSSRFLMRKLRLSSSFNKHRAGLKLINELKRKFGETAAFVMGNWSAPHARYREPIRGKEFRVLLRKNVFEVFLIDDECQIHDQPVEEGNKDGVRM